MVIFLILLLSDKRVISKERNTVRASKFESMRQFNLDRIIRAQLAMYTFFGNLKNDNECGRVVKALDSGSDVCGLKPRPTIFLFLC